MEEEKLRGLDIGFLISDPDTDWMWDLNNPVRRERAEELVREMLRNIDIPKPKEPLIITTANPNPNSWLYENFMPKPEVPIGELRPTPFIVEKGNKDDVENWRNYYFSGMPVIDTTKMFIISPDWSAEKPKWYNKIVLPYISISYDKYWHQIVFGWGKWKIGVGCIYWKRWFGIGRAWNKEYEEHKKEEP